LPRVCSRIGSCQIRLLNDFEDLPREPALTEPMERYLQHRSRGSSTLGVAMKFTIGSVAIAATFLLVVRSSTAQTVASTAIVPAPVTASLQAELTSGQILVAHDSSETRFPLDGLLMWALGGALVAIQLRRRQKTFRAPLLRY
jgi:hypothetical protein